MDDTPQLRAWRAEFGDRYIERNQPTPETDAATATGFAQILGRLPSAPSSILEVGPNVGRNLRGLQRVTTADLWAVEPNPVARRALGEFLPSERVLDGHTGAIPLENEAMDLVFTAGVLIHVPDTALDAASDEMYRVCRLATC